jgi:hypothetical protein
MWLGKAWACYLECADVKYQEEDTVYDGIDGNDVVHQ